MIPRLFLLSLFACLCLGLLVCLGGWNYAAAAAPGQVNQVGAWEPGGGGMAGPDSQKKVGTMNEGIGLLCQMGGMMEGGNCGPGGGPGYQPGTPGQSPGANLFRQNCAGCHANGGNTINPDLPLRGSQQLQDFNTFRIYLRYPTLPNGAPGAMPAFSSGRISDSQLQELYRYLVSLWGK
ncbi:MAG: c-type cytochrome [Desulfobaccales bacterium]